MTADHRAIIAAALLAIGCVCAIQCASHPVPYVDHHDEPGVYGAVPRSPKWPAVRTEYMRSSPRCEACGTVRDLNVHHVIPFHERPDLELSKANLITLCRKHHFEIGHLCGDGNHNWALCSNPRVREDAAKMREER